MLSVLVRHVSSIYATGQETEFFPGESALAEKALSRWDLFLFDPYLCHQIPVFLTQASPSQIQRGNMISNRFPHLFSVFYHKSNVSLWKL